MSKLIVENMEECFYDVQIYHDEVPTGVSEDKLKCLLDHAEAKRVNLDMKAYFEVVNRIVGNSDGSERISVVAVERSSKNPVGLCTFLQRSVEGEKIHGFPGIKAVQELMSSSRKVFYELQYCVRSASEKGRCVGDIVLSCGLEALNDLVYGRPVTSIVWLIVAGSFRNQAALRLYLNYRFEVMGLYEETCMMALFNLGEKVGKIREVLQRNLEMTFLLPKLKSLSEEPQRLQDSSQDSSQEWDDTVSSQDEENVNSQNSLVSATSVATTTSGKESVRIRPLPGTASRVPVSDSALTQVSADMLNELENVKFRKIIDQMKLSVSVVYSVSGTTEDMESNICLMGERTKKNEECFSFLQHLQLARQIEEYANVIDKNTYDAILQLGGVEGIDYTLSYLRDIVRVSWCVYRFPILEQARLPWNQAVRKIPKLAAVMDSIIEDKKRFPENILGAQFDRHSIYLKVAIRYPEDQPTDGDGLGFAKLEKVYGLYINEDSVQDDELMNHCRFRSVVDSVGSRWRSRLMGFDTQESPLEDGRIESIPQPHWRVGKSFLVGQLEELRQGIRPEEAIIFADCYGKDIFQRLLIDIRGIYERRVLQNIPEPSLRRFEMAEAFLREGVAYPTFGSYTDDHLLRAFSSARDNKRGAFADGEPEFINPALCRKRRWETERNAHRSQRKRYRE